MKRENVTWTFLFVAFATAIANFYVANASDPSPLQDFCVGVDDPKCGVYVNGKFCKNPKNVTIEDFVFQGFNIPTEIDNPQGAAATMVNANLFPALNTLGVTMSRIDFAPFGLNTPHLHPRSSEIQAVIKGTLYAGFVTTDYRLYDTILKEGNMIVFPQGLIHFQLNLGKTDALAMSSFGSQNPGRVNVLDSLFGTKPRILDDVLTGAFQVNETVIQFLRSQFYSSQNISLSAARSSIMELLSHKYKAS